MFVDKLCYNKNTNNNNNLIINNLLKRLIIETLENENQKEKINIYNNIYNDFNNSNINNNKRLIIEIL